LAVADRKCTYGGEGEKISWIFTCWEVNAQRGGEKVGEGRIQRKPTEKAQPTGGVLGKRFDYIATPKNFAFRKKEG